VVLSGRREVLIETLGQAAVDEIADREALDVPVASYDVFLTSGEIAGKSLEQLALDVSEVRGVFLRGIKRGGQPLPVAPQTTVERGDVLSLSGPEPAVVRVAARAGRIVAPTDETDFVTLGLGIFSGVLAGAVIVIPIGALRIPIGTSIGALLAGLVVGYVHSRRPLFGRIPDGALSLMNALGLSSFVAMVGLGAGPHFVEGLREAGVGLFFGGMVVTTVPLVAGLLVGRYVLKLNPLLLLGGIAGAQTMTAALAAVQERSRSTVAVLGYSGTAAVGHILLAIWGTVIVKLMS
jgi:putative transport protein